ncbi:MAG: rhamnulokinase family protein [Chloroflexota bacterium]
MTSAVVAVDLGASSGRVVVGRVGPGELRLEEVHRFPNEPVALPDGLHWDVLRLYREILDGLRVAARRDPGDPPASIGVDSWGVDFGLLDRDGALVGNPLHYRDPRHEAGVEAVHERARQASLYRRAGIQFLPFNTLYQLAALQDGDAFARARTMLLMPDLIGHWLTGEVAAEETNASTTGLLDPATREWAWDLIETLGFEQGLFPSLRRPGAQLGPIRGPVAEETGLAEGTTVVHVGSHDTASAVVGVPAGGPRFAYIACGTWSLVGVEVDRPVLTEESRAANFTNEAGVDGRVRYLRNVMGLWLLQEAMRTWERGGEPEELGRLLAVAAALPPGGPVVDPDEPVFLPPGDMPSRIEDACLRAGAAPPSSRAATVRCILDSLAAAYARAVDDASRLSGVEVTTIHLVGGGALNELLCQLTADACGRPVIAGPVEATAVGNVLVQARAGGLVEGDLEALRALVRATHDLRRYEPATARSRRRGALVG